MAVNIFSVAVVCLSFTVITCAATDVTVVTNVGTFIGEKIKVDIDETTSVHVATFLGIPYAEPPVGLRRFRPPAAKIPSTTHRIVKTYSNRCLEMGPTIPEQASEDCLYLNIFAPDRFSDESLPVMVFIHGGGFILGSANDYDGHTLAAYGQTIVVTINYRLSIWGFLSTDDWNSPGNYGLWDQRLAIEWVHNNIGAFGGDNKRITIFGESAGAASVVFQGLFPGNMGLFQRMIAQSGSAEADWPIMPTPGETTKRLAKTVGCDNSTVASMMECLRSIPATELNSKVTMEYIYSPCVDNVFVTCSPKDIFNLEKDSPSFQDARNVFASFDLMHGINSVEGGLVLDPVYGVLDPETFFPNKTYFDEVLIPLMTIVLYRGQLDSRKADLLIQAAIEKYTDDTEPTNPLKIREQFMQLYGDILFLAPMHATASAHARLTQRGSYMYYLSVNASYHAMPSPSWFQGANHADDLMYLFPTEELFSIFNEEEKILSGLMLTMWTNFAKTGNPNEPRTLGLTWEPYLENNRRYLELNENVTTANLKDNLNEDRAYFWNVVVPGIIGAEDKVCNYKPKDTSKAPRFISNSIVVMLTSIVFVHLIHVLDLMY